MLIHNHEFFSVGPNISNIFGDHLLSSKMHLAFDGRRLNEIFRQRNDEQVRGGSRGKARQTCQGSILYSLIEYSLRYLKNVIICSFLLKIFTISTTSTTLDL